MKIRQDVAMVVVIIIALLGVILLVYAYQKQQAALPSASEQSQVQPKGTNEQEQEINKKIEEVVQKRIEEKRQEIEKKPESEVKTKGYTQEEVNFILDPEKTVKQELGITPATSTNASTSAVYYTPDQIEDILNPKTKN